MNKDYEHALVLLQQQRSDLAEEKLRQSLANDPNHAMSHTLLALCLCDAWSSKKATRDRTRSRPKIVDPTRSTNRDRLEEATFEAERAVQLAPELADAHAALSRAWCLRRHLDRAEQSIQEALRLEPWDADHHAQHAAIALERRDWPATLTAAESGLEQDPEHVGCNNLRAMALVKLGRRDEAGATIAAALARAPESAFTHANQGWIYLHEGKRQQALEHFREALRLDPDMDFARAGIVEAMKSKNWIYAFFLRYFLWMAGLSRTTQWVIVLGGYFGYQALARMVDNNPALGPWFRPIMLAYILFAIMTWLASPLFNLLLRLDRFGRHALSREQIVASNWIGCLAFLALTCAAIWLGTDFEIAFAGMAYFGLLLLPVSAVFNCDAGWPRRIMVCYVSGLAVAGIAWMPLGMLGFPDQASLCIEAFVWGCFLSSLFGNFLAMQTARR